MHAGRQPWPGGPISLELVDELVVVDVLLSVE